MESYVYNPCNRGTWKIETSKNCEIIIFKDKFDFRLLGEFLRDIPHKLPYLEILDLEQCPNIELSDLQDLLRKNTYLVIKVRVSFRSLVCIFLCTLNTVFPSKSIL